jgi:triacylglycerol lipase
MFAKRAPPKPSLRLVTHPESDTGYMHFEPQMADGSVGRAVDVTPFETSASGLSPVNAWWLAEASLLSYWDAASTAARLREQAGLESECFDRRGTQGFVAWNDESAIVAFRGTQPNERADVWSDIDFLPTRWEKGGNVHEGFAAALDAVWDAIAARLRALGGRTVWFTGHSLGAAVATLAADRFGAPHGVYTLGSPRVGDPDFAAEFNARHAGRSFRYVNNHDVVTHVPPSRWRFSHVDSEQHFDGDGRLASVTVRGADVLAAAAKHLSEGIDLIVSGASVIPPGVIDHTPRRYTTFVWNAFVDSFVQA